jgi:hypothetical protein
MAIGGIRSLDKTPEVGEIGENGVHSQAGRAGIFYYGWPTAQSLEPNVAAQWLFDESSGNIVDEVGGLSYSAGGAPTYSVDTTSYSVSMALGITGAANAVFTKAGAEATLDLDTDDGVIEWVASVDASAATDHVFDFNNGTDGYRMYYSSSGPSIGLVLVSTVPTTASAVWTVSGLNDGVFRKFRITVDRSGNAELFINGITQGTKDISSIAAENVKCQNGKIMGHRTRGDWTYLGTMNELRLTIGNLTNNSGGPGNG